MNDVMTQHKLIDDSIKAIMSHVMELNWLASKVEFLYPDLAERLYSEGEHIEYHANAIKKSRMDIVSMELEQAEKAMGETLKALIER